MAAEGRRASAALAQQRVADDAYRTLISRLSLASMSAQADGASTQSRFDRWLGPLGVGLAVLGLLVIATASAAWIGGARGWAYDFSAYFDAAQRLVTTGSPYQADLIAAPYRPGPYGLYLYAPPLAVLFTPLTAIGAEWGATVWLAMRVLILAATCVVMPVSRPVRLTMFGVAALSAPVLVDLNLGNVSLIVTFVTVLGWRWLDRPVSGVALSFALTLRPTMALLAVWWLVRGVWRPFAWMAVTGLAIIVLTIPFVGIAGWVDYVSVLHNVSNVTGVARNFDLGSAVLLFGGPAGAALAALYAGYAIAIVAVVLSLRRDREVSFVITVVATLLLSPLLWDHYLTLLLVPAAFLASRGKPAGLLLPLLCWIPTILVLIWPDLARSADGILPFVALAGLLLPFAVADRGEPAAKTWRQIAERRSTRPART